MTTTTDELVGDDVLDLPEIRFPDGLPGLTDSQRFALVRWSGDPHLALLVDLDNPRLRLLVVPPDVFFPGYAATIDDTTCARIGLDEPADALLLVILTLAEDVATANLLGPIVVNLRNRTAVQAILSDSTFAARTPLPGSR